MVRCLFFLASLFVAFGLHAESQSSIDAEFQATLKMIVDINSDSRNATGLEEVRKIVVPRFEALGFQTTRYAVGNGHHVVSFDMPGSNPTLLMIGHIDTVFSTDSTFLKFRSEGDRLVGPGVIDMKGGVVLMLNILSDLQRDGLLPNVRVVLNDDEEIGSPFSKATLRQLARGIKYGLVFEPGLDDGALVKGQAGVRWLRLTVHGKAAHAGLEPQNGINACVELAYKINKIVQLNSYQKHIYVNPGVIEGGTKPNVVCAKASTVIDVRFLDLEDFEKTRLAIQHIADNATIYNAGLREGPTAELSQIAEMPLFREIVDGPLLAAVVDAGKKVSQIVTARAVGYASDANNLDETGIFLMVGLGPYGGGMHTEQEYMTIKSYTERLALGKELIRNLLNRRNNDD